MQGQIADRRDLSDEHDQAPDGTKPLYAAVFHVIAYPPVGPRNGCRSIRSSRNSRASRNCSIPMVIVSWPAAVWARDAPNDQPRPSRPKPERVIGAWPG